MASYVELLDSVLKRFAENSGAQFTHHDFIPLTDNYPTRLQLLKYLEDRGYIMLTHDQTQHYSITVEGVMFFHSGGFTKLIRSERRSRQWERVKLWATVSYSVAVLLVAVWAVNTQSGSNVEARAHTSEPCR